MQGERLSLRKKVGRLLTRVRSKLLLWVMAGSATAIILSLFFVTQLTSASTIPLPTMSLSGTVYSGMGYPAPGTVVVLKVLDNTYTILPRGSLDLVKTTVDQNGHFVLDTSNCCSDQTGTLAKLAEAHEGDINMQIIGDGENAFIVSNFPVGYETNAGQAVFTPKSGRTHVDDIKLQSGRGLVQSIATASNPGPFAQDEANPFIGEPPISLDPAGSTVLGSPGGISQSKLSPADRCYSTGAGAEFYWLQPRWYAEKRWLPVQSVSTRYHGYVRYEWETSDTTTMGVAVTGGWHFQAGMSHSTNEFHQDGAGWDDRGVLSTRHLMRDWLYARYRGKCYGGYDVDYKIWWMSAYMWTPHAWGGSATYKKEAPATWKCTNPNFQAIIKGADVYYAQGSSETFGWSFQPGLKLATLQVNGSQESSEKRLQHWWHRPGQVAKICGNDNRPPAADYIREMDHS
jgi:hypothetical protein